MQRFEAAVEGLSIDAQGRRLAHLALPANIQILPGQPLLISERKPSATVADRIFPQAISANTLTCRQPPGSGWRPGLTLSALGPIGSGFEPPDDARHWLLLALQDSWHTLQPLVQQPWRGRAAVAVWSDSSLARADLPPEVEIISSPAAALDWADYVAIALPATVAPTAGEALGIPLPQSLPEASQVLMITDMLCGFGACNVCAVKARRGWGLACRQGPVFALRAVPW
jgi:hypothetical protein